MRPLRSPGLRFSVVFGVEMWPLLDSHAVQRHAARQALDDALPEIHRDAFSGGDPRTRRERRDVFVNMPPVEPVDDFALEQSIERVEPHDATARGIEWTLHGHGAAIAMAVIVR